MANSPKAKEGVASCQTSPSTARDKVRPGTTLSCHWLALGLFCPFPGSSVPKLRRERVPDALNYMPQCCSCQGFLSLWDSSSTSASAALNIPGRKGTWREEDLVPAATSFTQGLILCPLNQRYRNSRVKTVTPSEKTFMSKSVPVVRGEGMRKCNFQANCVSFFPFLTGWVYLALCLSSSSRSQVAALVFLDPADLHQAGSELCLFMGVEPAEAPGSFPFLKLIVSISYVTVPITSHFEICHSSLLILCT